MPHADECKLRSSSTLTEFRRYGSATRVSLALTVNGLESKAKREKRRVFVENGNGKRVLRQAKKINKLKNFENAQKRNYSESLSLLVCVCVCSVQCAITTIEI